VIPPACTCRRIFARELLRHAIHVRLRSGRGYAVFQPREDQKIMIIAIAVVRIGTERSPQCEVLRGELEIRRKHADDRKFRVVGRSLNGPANRRGIAAKLLLPAAIAQYGNWVALGRSSSDEQSSQERLNAKHGKETS
jgi:hypothetical protein